MKNLIVLGLAILASSFTLVQAEERTDSSSSGYSTDAHKPVRKCVVVPAGGGYPVPQPNYTVHSVLEGKTHTLSFEDGFDPVGGPTYKGSALFFPGLVVHSLSPTSTLVEIDVPRFLYVPVPRPAKMRILAAAYEGGQFGRYWRCMEEGLDEGDRVLIINHTGAPVPLLVSVSAYWHRSEWGNPIDLPETAEYFALVGDSFSIRKR